MRQDHFQSRAGEFLRRTLLALALLTALALAAVGQTAFADSGEQSFFLTYVPPCGYEQAEVEVQKVQSRWYLFLPASADYRSLTLRGPRKAELRASGHDLSLRLDDKGVGEALDLTTLFGNMSAGKAYTLDLSWKNGKVKQEQKVLLLQSANLSSLHITLNKSLSDINASVDKSVSGAGYAVKLSPDGHIEAEAGVEKLNGRGNASWKESGEKRAYSVKLNTEAELVSGAGAAKKWCLLSNNVAGHDTTGLYNTTVMNLFAEMNGSSALRAENVDLYVNGRCRGTYLLSEKPEIDTERVDVRETRYAVKDREHVTRVSLSTAGASADVLLSAGIQSYQYATGSELRPGGEGGYLLELDFRYLESECWFVTRKGIPVVVVEPEYVGYEQMEHIALFVQEMEDALYSASGFNAKGRYYTEYLDLESFALRYAVDCFAADRDSFLASEYFYTDLRRDGSFEPLRSGPAWDFDYGSPKVKALIHPSAGLQSNGAESWMYRILSKGDFNLALRHACVDVMMPLWKELNEGKLDESIENLKVSQTINELLWLTDYEQQATEYRRALKARYGYWESTIWGDRTVQGVEIVSDGGELRARIEGRKSSLAWYRVNPEEGWKLEIIEGAEDEAFRPEADGIYVAAVKGAGVAFNPAVNGYSGYKVDGRYLPVAQEAIVLYSAPCPFEKTPG